MRQKEGINVPIHDILISNTIREIESWEKILLQFLVSTWMYLGMEMYKLQMYLGIENLQYQ